MEAELDDDRVTSCPERLSFPERSGKTDKAGGRVEFQEELAFKLNFSVFETLQQDGAHLTVKVSQSAIF